MRWRLATATALLAVLTMPGSSTAQDPAPLTLDGVPVALHDGTTQVITVRATGRTIARVTFWSLTNGTWRQRARTTVGRLGFGGLVDPLSRKQGSGTTPTGTYYLPYAFGPGPKQRAWKLRYRDFDNDDYWVGDNASAAYNRFRDRDLGGFRWSRTDRYNGSEHLVDYRSQYRVAVVIAYNYYAPVRHRGTGIFLHVNGPGATAGCVSAPLWFLRSTMTLLDPTRKPVIAIGR